MTVVEQVSFADLYLHPLNPRLDPPQAEIDALATNIRELGLIQNLAGLRDEAGKVGVIAGGRRLRALAQLQDDDRFALVPVKLAEDEATAAVWAAAENSQRSALHPADEIHEYALLRDKGVSEAAIAIAFGVTKAHVKRRLRLARLPETVLAALRADKIGLSEAGAFVVCDDLARVDEVLARISGHPGSYSEDSIKRLLKAEAVRDTDRRARFVGVPAYREAGGRISTDLFGGEVYLDDVTILDACFATRLAAVAEETCERDGWKWVQTSDHSHPCSISNELDAVVLYPSEGALSDDEAAPARRAGRARRGGRPRARRGRGTGAAHRHPRRRLHPRAAAARRCGPLHHLRGRAARHARDGAAGRPAGRLSCPRFPWTSLCPKGDRDGPAEGPPNERAGWSCCC